MSTPQPAQRLVGDPSDPFGGAVESHRFAVLDPPAELGRHHHLVPHRGECLTDEFLVDEGAIHLRRVEEIYPDSTASRSTRSSPPVSGVWTVALRHAHAAKADRRDLQALTECSCVHRGSLDQFC